MNGPGRIAIPGTALVIALVLMDGCTVGEDLAGPEESSGSGAPAQAFEPSCEVVSCTLPAGSPPCVLAVAPPRSFSVPHGATLVFRSEIPGSSAAPPPYRFVWRFEAGGATAQPPASNDRESRVQHIYASPGLKDVTLTVTDGSGLTFEKSPACQVSVIAGTTPGGRP